MAIERWAPATEADIREAIQEDIIRESHYFDAKREIEDASGARKELARDLASFAIDGGGLLIGLDEDETNRTWALAPQPLRGQPERIELVATSLVDPPLYVRTREIPSAEDPTQGYVYVEVPESDRAPHMVGGIYFGRGDKTRVRLSDAEVTRLHLARHDLALLADRLLDTEIERDPIRGDEAGHLYLIAQPLTADREVARSLVREQVDSVYRLLRRASDKIERPLRDVAPSLDYASETAIRSAGVARCSESLAHGRVYQGGVGKSANAVDVEVREDGGVRVFVGRMTGTNPGPSWQTEPVKWINDGLAVAYSLLVVHAAGEVAEQTDYSGSWTFGLAAAGLSKGICAHAGQGPYIGVDWPVYDSDTYRGSTVATLAEIQDNPGRVAERFVGALVRGLGTSRLHAHSLGG